MHSKLKPLLMSALLSVSVIASSGVTAQQYLKTEHLYPKTIPDRIVNVSAGYKSDSLPYGVFEYIDTFGSTEAEIVNRLGEPEERFEWQEENRHESDVKNTVITLVYDGLIIELVEVKQKTFIKRLFIESCEINSPFQNYLCKPVPAVISELGQPRVIFADELIYTLQHGDVGSTPMRMGVKNDKISWIYLRDYID